jgi:hypothetical protein
MRFVSLFLSLSIFCNAAASGIPEPGIILYGGVTNVVGAVARPMNQGILQWEVQSGDRTQRLKLQAEVAGGRYRLRVPFETLAGGAPASGVSFILGGGSAGGTQLENVSLRWTNGASYPATWNVSMAVFNLGFDQRAAVRRVDVRLEDAALMSSGSARPSSFQGPGWWDGSEPAVVPSGMRFTGIWAHPEGGVQVEWAGVPGGRGHYLVRAPVVEGQLEEYEVVRWFPAGTTTGFRDTNAVHSATYFYRMYTP